MWPWAYSIWQVLGFELAHGILSALCSLLVSLPVVYWIWTTYRMPSESILDTSLLKREDRVDLVLVVFCMLLLSLGVGLCAHVLEDLYVGWF